MTARRHSTADGIDRHLFFHLNSFTSVEVEVAVLQRELTRSWANLLRCRGPRRTSLQNYHPWHFSEPETVTRRQTRFPVPAGECSSVV